MQLIVLSAGKGSRLPQEFRNKPKCLVEINSKPLLLYNQKFFDRFKKKIIVTGYKHSALKAISENIGFTNIVNKKYSTTNMVYSLFLTKELIKEDVIVVYGDVIFKDSIYSLLKKNDNIITVNINWFENWKKRMPLRNILNDAENLITKKKDLLEIGTKINKNKIPKYQFMGVLKLQKESFLKCFNYFETLNNKTIDMTSFLNLCISNNIISLKIEKYNDYWYEVDTISDHKYTEREVKRW